MRGEKMNKTILIKAYNIALILLLLSGMLLFVGVHRALADGESTIDLCATRWINDDSTSSSPYRHSFDADGLKWDFFHEGDTWYYNIGNGSMWGNKTALSGQCYQDVYFDGTYVHCAGAYTNESSYGNVSYRRGMPQVDGSMVWDSEVTVFNGATYYRIASIALDDTGRPFIGAYWNNTPATSYGGITMFWGDATDGTFGTVSTQGLQVSQGVPLSGVYSQHIFNAGSGFMVEIFNYAGVGLRSVRFVPGFDVFENAYHEADTHVGALDAWSGVSVPGGVMLVYLTAVSYDINETDYTHTANDFSASVPLVLSQGEGCYPSISYQYDGSYRLYWIDPSYNLYRKTYQSGAWDTSVLLETIYMGDTFGYRASIFTTANVGAYQAGVGYYYGVCYDPSMSNLKWWDDAEDCVNYHPTGVTLSAQNIQATMFKARALITCDGNIGNISGGTAYWDIEGVNGDWRTVTHIGGLATGYTISDFIGNCTPDTDYSYEVVFVGVGGWTSRGGVQTLHTAARVLTTAPRVETQPVTNLQANSTQLNGWCIDDGGLACVAGFGWRVVGATGWNYIELNTLTVHSGDAFWYHLTGLVPNTSYEYYAYCVNTRGEDDDSIVAFNTYMSPHPTPGTGQIHLPDVLTHFFDSLNGSVKMGIGIFVILGLMICVGYMLRKSKSAAAIGMLGVVVGMIIFFTIIGWFPAWIIIFVGIVCGFGVLIMIGGKL
jgi:hypothetical protein